MNAQQAIQNLFVQVQNWLAGGAAGGPGGFFTTLIQMISSALGNLAGAGDWQAIVAIVIALLLVTSPAWGLFLLMSLLDRVGGRLAKVVAFARRHWIWIIVLLYVFGGLRFSFEVFGYTITDPASGGGRVSQERADSIVPEVSGRMTEITEGLVYSYSSLPKDVNSIEPGSTEWEQVQGAIDEALVYVTEIRANEDLMITMDPLATAQLKAIALYARLAEERAKEEAVVINAATPGAAAANPGFFQVGRLEREVAFLEESFNVANFTAFEVDLTPISSDADLMARTGYFQFLVNVAKVKASSFTADQAELEAALAVKNPSQFTVREQEYAEYKSLVEFLQIWGPTLQQQVTRYTS